MHRFNGSYAGENLHKLAFPLGGIGAGMICLEGAGAFSHVSLRHKPEVFHEPQLFAAVHWRDETPGAGSSPGSPGSPGSVLSRVLEGQVPRWKIFGGTYTGNGLTHRTYGLPRCHAQSFTARMPFAEVRLQDPALGLEARLTGWSPFIPTDSAASSLPMAAVEYELINQNPTARTGVFSFHSANFLRAPRKEAPRQEVRRLERGFILRQPGSSDLPHEEAALAVQVLHEQVNVDAAWFRGQWFDALTTVWNHIAAGAAPDQPPPTTGPASPGASVYVPFQLDPGQSVTIPVLFCWYVPHTDHRYGTEEKPAQSACSSGACACSNEPPKEKYRPWYARQYAGIDAVAEHWRTHYADLRKRSAIFTDCFYDTTLPAEVVEAVAANLTILKTPTVLRQHDGRLWCWEGCGDANGCCSGSCTHVWNYAQALPHLFADLERTLRETEFHEAQNDAGKQAFRASLPIRTTANFDAHAAADGQLGGIMKVHRDWRIAGDTAWLRRLWPAVRRSMDYCISAWDPDHEGVLKEPHHNTYDIEFWGPDGMCSSFYLGALQAMIHMGTALQQDVSRYQALFTRGQKYLHEQLYNGEYFQQQVRWQDLHADATQFAPLIGGDGNDVPEALTLMEKEGPKYQYGSGCLSDGVLGAWMAQVCGVGEVLDGDKIVSHLRAVHRHNLKHDLTAHANPQRPGFAVGAEGGLLLCTWPRGGKPALPFVYSDEVWTGIEYQVAAHLLRVGCVEEGLEIVRVARQRYDGRDRNPFNEYECGHWYARAMSSYALLEGLSGARYDAVTKTLTLQPTLPGDFRAFLSTATGFGTVGVHAGKPFIEVKYGRIDVAQLELQA